MHDVRVGKLIARALSLITHSEVSSFCREAQSIVDNTIRLQKLSQDPFGQGDASSWVCHGNSDFDKLLIPAASFHSRGYVSGPRIRIPTVYGEH